MAEEQQNKNTSQLEGGTYEIIQGRLKKHKTDLSERLGQLNDERKKVFGAVETQLIANDRINTENVCTARDIIALGNNVIFGYNVHFGLRKNINIADVFGGYEFKDSKFHPTDLELIQDEAFINDFTNLYNYYRDTLFTKFVVLGNYLYMVFQNGDKATDLKAFKWLIADNQLQYVDNRSSHEVTYPDQQEFTWQTPSRDMHRYGAHPHVSILDKVFVETIGGDLTIKIEDNTDDGKGIYSEPVEFADQTLDDGQYQYGDLGSLTIVKIKPYQEEARHFVYNHKVKEVHKINSVKDAVIMLPDNQGILFPNGYYLQTGEFKLFERSVENVKFRERIVAPNGEDYFYVFYEREQGVYVLISYNIIAQEVKTPIICSGFTIFESGEMAYFSAETAPTKHHVVQIWQTPYSKEQIVAQETTDSFLYKIGNKDIVKGMAECQELITLLNKQDNYSDLYADVSKTALDILDSYYWINDKQTFNLNIPLKEIHSTANSAIDEFEKVVQLKKEAVKATEEVQTKIDLVLNEIKQSTFKSIDDFVSILTQLRQLRGETIGLKDVRYTDATKIEELEVQIVEQNQRVSRRSIEFLANDKALVPYEKRVAEKEQAIEKVAKRIQAKALNEEVTQIGTDLELLIEIVNNLEIEDTSQATQIIEKISVIFAHLNQVKTALSKKANSIGKQEMQADFTAQLKLLDQSIINYLDVADTPEKCDEYLTKLSVQLEELEGKYSDFDEFIPVIIEKREEVYSAFESRKNGIIEQRNKRALTLNSSAERILKSIRSKAETLKSNNEINAYFASDLMVDKLRDLIVQLEELQENGKAETLTTSLKSAKEEVLRKLKDKQDLYEDGENIIRFGAHKFGVNRQPLDLSIVHKDEAMFYHLSGTDFYEKIEDEILTNAQDLWEQELVSENAKVYRAEFLAYKIYKEYQSKNQLDGLTNLSSKERKKLVSDQSKENYSEGYLKGIHDEDATLLLETLIQTEQSLGLLKYTPTVRARAQFFWVDLSESEREKLLRKIQTIGTIRSLFPESKELDFVVEEIQNQLNGQFPEFNQTKEIANYLIDELSENKDFVISAKADELADSFQQFLQTKNVKGKLKSSLEKTETVQEKIELLKQWLTAFLSRREDTFYLDEIVALVLFGSQSKHRVNQTVSSFELNGLKGVHTKINENVYWFDYHLFLNKLDAYFKEIVPKFYAFREEKKTLLEQKKSALRLKDFMPTVLTSFVRSQLIDKVYLPLFGENLAKQLGTVGNNKRTDRMGMLLLVSPPGYGKTTLMEYIANRLGLVFMKIDGPSIGHHVTSLDPMSANNSTARNELLKLNLSFEMGNNVMLYLDDIQHCNPEFLQKFISLADGQRKVEGVSNGQPTTFNMRGKKFCVIMAGNPYTESGEKFKIPDMLANRADIYNLGDIVGESSDLFEMSLIENSITANPTLRTLFSKNTEDLYTLIDAVEKDSMGGVELKGNYSKQEIEAYFETLKKVKTIQETILKVNQNYISSAAMEDEYRTEPSFKLQGSYRDMNKLVAKVVPIMNEQELNAVIQSHYENESQTLTQSAEANLLKFKELTQTLSDEDIERWAFIKKTFNENQKLKGIGKNNDMAQILGQIMRFTDGIEDIKEVLQQGLNNVKKE